MSQKCKSSCRYSKAMNQPYPRLCVDCGEPELMRELASENYMIEFLKSQDYEIVYVPMVEVIDQNALCINHPYDIPVKLIPINEFYQNLYRERNQNSTLNMRPFS